MASSELAALLLLLQRSPRPPNLIAAIRDSIRSRAISLDLADEMREEIASADEVESPAEAASAAASAASAASAAVVVRSGVAAGVRRERGMKRWRAMRGLLTAIVGMPALGSRSEILLELSLHLCHSPSAADAQTGAFLLLQLFDRVEGSRDQILSTIFDSLSQAGPQPLTRPWHPPTLPNPP